MKKENKRNIFLYFIFMAILFIAVDIVIELISGNLQTFMTYFKNGSDALNEMLFALFALIIVLLFKNKYIFTQNREPFFRGFKYILPEVILSILFILTSLSDLSVSENIIPIINLIVFTLFIGIAEEFLFRGWVLNEFLERFSNNKKNIILSIVLSSLIFGLMHLPNAIGDEQGLADTVVQVLNATAGGVFLALVYYKTKNIWLTVFSHALWDFSTMLSQVDIIVDCYSTGSATHSIITYDTLIAICFIVGYLFFIYWIYQKTDLCSKPNKNKLFNTMLVVTGVLVYFLAPTFIEEPAEYESYYVCPIYGTKEFSEFEWTYSHKLAYDLEITKNEENIDEIEPETYKLELIEEDNKLYLTNLITNEKVILSDSYFDYLLIENTDSYIIFIETSSTTVLYGKYNKTDVSNDTIYLDTVKSGLEEFHVPEIYLISRINFENDDYSYASISCSRDALKMYFDQDGILYFIEIV